MVPGPAPLLLALVEFQCGTSRLVVGMMIGIANGGETISAAVNRISGAVTTRLKVCLKVAPFVPPVRRYVLVTGDQNRPSNESKSLRTKVILSIPCRKVRELVIH